MYSCSGLKKSIPLYDAATEYIPIPHGHDVTVMDNRVELMISMEEPVMLKILVKQSSFPAASWMVKFV